MPGGGRRRREDRRHQSRGELSRTRLLDAGLEVFAELTIADLLSEIGPRRVVRQLGDISAGAFYHHFPDRAAYLEALVDHALGPPADRVGPETAARLSDLADGPVADAMEAIDEVCRRDFEREATVGLLALRFQLCAWVAHEEPAVQVALRRYYDRFTAQYVAAYDHLLERWGREFRPPFTPRSAAAVLTALVEGLVVRHGVDPEAAPPELFSQAVRALLVVMTRATGDPESLDEALAALGRLSGSPTPSHEDAEARRRTLDAALARADAGTYDDASLDEIAREARVEPTAVHERFLSKPGLAAATFARFLPMLERPLRADLEEQRDPVEAIRRHLGRLAEVATRHRGLTNALLDAVQTATIRYGSHIGPNDPRAIVPLPQLLVPAVEAGQERGVIRSDFEAFELAAVTTNLMLLRVMTRPGEDPTDAAQLVSEVVLVGISVRP
jgi:AcrR family transcriptional regulator